MITLRVPILTRRIFTLIWKRDERVAQKHVLGIFFHPMRYFKDKKRCCAKLYISGKCSKPAAHNVRRQKAKPSTANTNPATEVFPKLFMCSQLYLRDGFPKQKNCKKFSFFHAALSRHANKYGPVVGSNFASYLGKVLPFLIHRLYIIFSGWYRRLWNNVLKQ